MVYLETAYHEFEKIKEKYLKWLNELQKKLENCSEEETKRLKADPKVPVLEVKIPLDAGEGAMLEPEDW